ncbi:LysM peptidoglycan-binding domain-containing protein [Solibacillus ferritrahens]|uniref:LysM peptidoglycan-binding domain-containing protein n=1 Tax=Solibacillus ferritrahens TaxID=3098620 RepID=UPI00300A7199
MAKEDYREKVEEHRQEIDLHNESGSKASRVSRHGKKSAKKQSNPMMTVLTVVLIFIPLTILGYVWLLYEPSTSAKEGASGGGQENLVEIQKQNPQTPASISSDDDKEETDTEKASENAKVDDEKAEKESLAAEEAKKAEEKLAKAKAEKDTAEAKKAEEAQKVAAAKAKELEEKKKAQEAAKAEQKTHTVSSSDNLYRIALKYYGNGSPAYIEKIKAANNLSSDSISAGQVLVIVP